MKSTIVIAAVLVASGVGYALWPVVPQTAMTENAISMEGGLLANVILPATLSQNAQSGKRGFEAKCAACHGVNAAGQDGVAPPLVHKVYEPSIMEMKASKELPVLVFALTTGPLGICQRSRALHAGISK